MVSSDLWTDLNSKLGEVFMMIPKKNFLVFYLTFFNSLYLEKNLHFHNFLIRIVQNIYWACNYDIYLNTHY